MTGFRTITLLLILMFSLSVRANSFQDSEDFGQRCFVQNIDIISYWQYQSCESCFKRHPRCEKICKEYYWICYAVGAGTQPTYFVAEDIDKDIAREKALIKCRENTSNCESYGCTDANRVIFQQECRRP